MQTQLRSAKEKLVDPSALCTCAKTHNIMTLQGDILAPKGNKNA